MLLTHGEKKKTPEKPSEAGKEWKKMCWLASAAIHRDSAEIGLRNVFGSVICLWAFVIIDCHGFSHRSLHKKSCLMPLVLLTG